MQEDGVYLKLALGHLLTAHYQTRVGILPACNYGTPQARNRWVLHCDAESLVAELDSGKALFIVPTECGQCWSCHLDAKPWTLPGYSSETLYSVKHLLPCCRVFVWAAMSGKEQLPPFPEPEFAGKPNMVHQIGKACLVTAPEGQQLQPMVSAMCWPCCGHNIEASHGWPCIVRACTYSLWPSKADNLLLLTDLCLLEQLLTPPGWPVFAEPVW